MSVIRNEELEEIGVCAFRCCRSLQHIITPNSIKTIKAGALAHCSGFTTVTLGNGQKDIGKYAFIFRTSLHEIMTPSAVKTINNYSFCRCYGFRTVTCGDLLEEIGVRAFSNCTS